MTLEGKRVAGTVSHYATALPRNRMICAADPHMPTPPLTARNSAITWHTGPYRGHAQVTDLFLASGLMVAAPRGGGELAIISAGVRIRSLYVRSTASAAVGVGAGH